MVIQNYDLEGVMIWYTQGSDYVNPDCYGANSAFLLGTSWLDKQIANQYHYSLN